MLLHRQKRKPKKQEARLKEGCAIILIRPKFQSVPIVAGIFKVKLLRITW